MSGIINVFYRTYLENITQFLLIFWTYMHILVLCNILLLFILFHSLPSGLIIDFKHDLHLDRDHLGWIVCPGGWSPTHRVNLICPKMQSYPFTFLERQVCKIKLQSLKLDITNYNPSTGLIHDEFMWPDFTFELATVTRLTTSYLYTY